MPIGNSATPVGRRRAPPGRFKALRSRDGEPALPGGGHLLRACSASAWRCSPVPREMSRSSGNRTRSRDGLVMKAPSRRTARTVAPVVARMAQSSRDRPAKPGTVGDVGLGQPNFEFALVHDHVQESRDFGVRHQGGHARSPDLVGVHHPVGADLFEFGDGGRFVGSGHYEEVGVQGPGGQGDVQVVCVGVERHDQGLGAVQPGLEDGVLLGGVSDHHQVPARSGRVI